MRENLALMKQQARLTAKLRRWEAGTMTRQNSLGLLPSGPDPVGEGCVQSQPPTRYIG
jgi:hypothetical protein